jgi:hypothetical protein
MKEVFFMRPLLLSSVALISIALSLPAQPVISAKSGTIDKAEGTVLLNGNPVLESATRFQDIKENGVVRTEDGRVEVLLPPGFFFRMGEGSQMKLLSNRLIDTRALLEKGSAVLEIEAINRDTNVTIAVADAQITFNHAGIYRFDTEPAQIKVFQGSASVNFNGSTTMVGAAHLLSLTDPSAKPEKFNPEDTDALDRWSRRRASYIAAANASSAKSLVGSSYMPIGWGTSGCSPAWTFNSYFNMMTYMPCNGRLYSPYGYAYCSPYYISRMYWVAPPVIYGGGGGRTAVVAPGSASAALARPAANAAAHAIAGAPPSSIGNRGGFGVGNMGNPGGGNSGFSAATSSYSPVGGGGGGIAAPSGGFSGGSAGGAGGAGHAGGGGGGGGAAGGSRGH